MFKVGLNFQKPIEFFLKLFKWENNYFLALRLIGILFFFFVKTKNFISGRIGIIQSWKSH